MKRQPPVYSPLSLGAIGAASVSALARGRSERSALQAQLRDAFLAEQVLLTASGTQALQIALSIGAGDGAGRVVALPAYSCFDLVTAVVWTGASVRFYDVDPVSLAPDMESLRIALSAGATAAVIGNLYGYPVDWAAVRSAASPFEVLLIEDAAQGVGSSSSSGRGGAQGDLTVLSFGRGKGWTGGGGGALLSRGSSAAARWWGSESDRVLEPSSLGMKSAVTTSLAWALGRPSLYWLPTSIPGLGLGETTYHEPVNPGAIRSFSAALARRTAPSATAAAGSRREVALQLVEALGGVGPAGQSRADESDDFRICFPIGGTQASAFLRLPVLVQSRDEAARWLREGKDLGIAPGYPAALHRLAQVGGMRIDREEHPGAMDLAERLVTLPTHAWIRSREIEAIARLAAGH